MAANLPLVQSEDQSLQLLQTRWKSLLDPLIRNQLTNGLMLTNIVLTTGDNVINHLLSRNQVGWFVVDQNAAVAIYRSQPLNDKTLTLNASGPATVSLWVF